MRSHLLKAPRWVLGVLSGLFFGLFITVFTVISQDERWPAALLGGGISGVLFGAIMGPVVHRQNQRALGQLGSIDAQQARATMRAAWRGPLPENPEARRAAHRMALHQRSELRRVRTLALTFFPLMIAVDAFLALSESSWWWLAAVFFALLLGYQLWLPSRLTRRAELLNDGDRPGTGAGAPA